MANKPREVAAAAAPADATGPMRDPPSRGEKGSRPVLTSVITTIVVFSVLTVGERRGFLGFLSDAPGDVEVPSIAGVTPQQARDILQAHHLLLTLQAERPDGKMAAGRIAEQVPLGGSRAPRSSTVQAFVSTGPSEVAIPILTGLRPDDAVAQLTERKLIPGPRRQEPHASVPAGMLIGTDPPPGKPVSPGTTVVFIVSAGPAMKPVPRVVGLRPSKAKKAIEDAGFRVGKTGQGFNEEYDDGVVIKQDPAGNTEAAAGSEISLTLNES